MPTTAVVKPTAITQWLTLLDAITSTTDGGGSTPCLNDPEPFTSGSWQQRAEAAAACSHCPVLTECRAYADAQAETWHVWAGADRTPTTRNKPERNTP